MSLSSYLSLIQVVSPFDSSDSSQTSVLELCLLMLTFALSFWCWKASIYLDPVKSSSHSENIFESSKTLLKDLQPSELSFQLLLFILPIFLVFSNLGLVFIVNSFLAGYALGLLNSKPKYVKSSFPNVSSSQKFPSKEHNGYLSVYRGTMMILTCFSILAVDFPIFPKRFAKTELYGQSLMDVGVGSFVFSSGIVGYRFWLKRDITPQKSYLVSVYKAFKSSFTVFLIGFLRLILTKLLNYQVSVTEYGVHWNFFFTLGFLDIFVHLIIQYSDNYAQFILPLLAVYQTALSFFDLENYILHAPRVNLLSQNKEGVFSFIGYLIIYFAGLRIGQEILKPVSKNTKNSKIKTLFFIWSSLLAAFVFSTRVLDMKISRRVVNLPYIILSVWLNTFVLWLFLVFDYIILHASFPYPYVPPSYHNKVPLILKAVNFNGLFIFLLANILTGLVNLAIREFTSFKSAMSMPPSLSFFILATYLSILLYISLSLHKNNIRIR
ncbi:GPI-anchored wall transfer protein 1 [Smittium mucronatum]|uniref:GPI-anchored wall transfer protein n=1 Tax=Smittium mucronatum TaxID=133383 RepID=A0A1R0GVS9_9FUNG|nr:GPI-anchored wall transfer protein 1 [Smittium mucronatum]